ncbi:hypothetical protein bcgnr5372_27350 [Bacillus luti]|nr:hypothetical protein [Bacillus cereus]HDR8331177.1 hypothetical protein [Bacillus cereus]HDR8338028.1 hypothetical protein [Bacillus cereus]
MSNNPVTKTIGNKNHDGLFKEMLCCFFKEYIEFTQPHVLEMLDFTHLIPRDTHVSGLEPIKRKGTDFYVDAAFEVNKRNGEKVIFHIEAQSYYQPEFPERMYEYNALCRIKYGLDVTSQAICFNTNQRNIPDNISYTDFTTGKVSNTSNYVKIDLNSYNINDHRNSDNLFVIATLGLMKGYDKLNPSEKAELKLQSYIKLYNNRLEKRRHSLISSFLEIYMVLDEGAHKSFISRLEEENQRKNGLEEWVMQMAENNEWAKIIISKKGKEKEKEFVKNIINRYKEKDDNVLAELANTTLDTVREAKRELESQKPPQ